MGRAHKRPQDIHAIGVMSEGNVETSSRCHIAEQSLLMEAGALIRQYRRELGLTGKQLGDRVGMSQQHVLRYERSNTELTLSKVGLFAAALGLTFPQFIHELCRVIEGRDTVSQEVLPSAIEKDVNTQNINTQNINSEDELRNYLYGDNAFTVEKNDLK